MMDASPHISSSKFYMLGNTTNYQGIMLKLIKSKCRNMASKLLTHTPVIHYIPVTVREGMAKGARWTLAPYTSYWRGNTEMDVEAAISLHGSIRGGVCWDWGTHFGIYTVGMAMAVGEKGQVVGFEPDLASFKRCERHVLMNNQHWVKLYNAAVSDTEGEGNLIQYDGSDSTTSHFAYDDENLNHEAKTIKVRTIRIDNLVARGEILPAQFIKIDVEGYGAKALNGAFSTIKRHLPTLVMSFHSQPELDGTRNLLEPLGYQSFTCDGNKIDWQECLYHNRVLRAGQ